VERRIRAFENKLCPGNIAERQYTDYRHDGYASKGGTGCALGSPLRVLKKEENWRNQADGGRQFR
jgi:hypothetical protein